MKQIRYGMLSVNRIIDWVIKGESHLTSKGLDGVSFLKLIRRHKLFSLLGMDFTGLFEAEVQTYLRNDILRLSIKSLQLAKELEEVISQISKIEIKIIAIKGPVLAQSLFGDVGQRHFGDLDLVVKRADVLKVIELLAGQGYKMISPKPGLKEKQWD